MAITALAVLVVVAWRRAVRGAYAEHRAWMIRSSVAPLEPEGEPTLRAA